MSPRLTFALEIIRAAGRSTLSHFQTNLSIERKADDSPVTIADKQAERMLRSAIEEKYPEDAVLGEEEGETGKGSGRWVIDPIDGTQSFVCGVPLYATLLSFEIEGDIQLAACYFPALDELLYAEKGGGTFWNSARCRVSNCDRIENAVIATSGPRGFVRTNQTAGMLDLAARCSAMRSWCDAYGHALVATGRVDAMLDPRVAYYDIAAMSLIIREAGGRFTSFSGQEVLTDHAISSNGLIHEALLEAF